MKEPAPLPRAFPLVGRRNGTLSNAHASPRGEAQPWPSDLAELPGSVGRRLYSSASGSNACYRAATTPGRTTKNQELLVRVEILVRRRSWLLLVALGWVLKRIRNQQVAGSIPAGGLRFFLRMCQTCAIGSKDVSRGGPEIAHCDGRAARLASRASFPLHRPQLGPPHGGRLLLRERSSQSLEKIGAEQDGGGRQPLNSRASGCTSKFDIASDNPSRDSHSSPATGDRVRGLCSARPVRRSSGERARKGTAWLSERRRDARYHHGRTLCCGSAGSSAPVWLDRGSHLLGHVGNVLCSRADGSSAPQHPRWNVGTNAAVGVVVGRGSLPSCD